MRNDDGRSVIRRVAEVLHSFQCSSNGLSMAEVSRRIDIPQSTAHRILTSLTAEGLLEKDSGGKYHVGLMLWQVTARSPRATGIQRVALPFMQDLYEITRFPVHLAIREHDSAVFIERLAPPGQERRRPMLGSAYPLHVTAVGLSLLANAPQGFQDEYLNSTLERITQFTVTDPLELRATLAEVRTRGYAMADRLVNSHALSIAAPIRGQGGQVLAAISVNVPSDQKGSTATLAHAVQVIALSITRACSARPG